MRKPNPFKLIIQVGITLVIFLVISFSCKREMSEPLADESDPGAPLPTSILPDAFPHRKVMLMSSMEVAGKQNFPASSIYNVGSEIFKEGADIFEPLGEIGGLICEVMEYKKTESRFDDIDNKLDKLSSQIDMLQTNIVDMENRLIKNMDHLSSYISQGNINNHSAPIRLMMKTGDIHEFGYWTNTAANYSKDTANPILKGKMEDLKANAQDFVDRIWNCDDNSSLRMAILNLYSDLCPPVGGKNDQALNIYVQKIIDDYKGLVVDTTSAMATYQMLEGYFLTVVSYQFQAATVYMNAANMKDSNGTLGYASTFWENDFVPAIEEELVQFRNAVDMLVVNMAEYRNIDRFSNDMQYSEMGIAPDKLFYHVLARSQFVSNLLSAAIGSSYPIVSGHILVPTRYLTDPEKPIFLRAGNAIVDTTGESIESVLPYTTWKKIKVGDDEMMQCNPDYNWSVFHFSVPNSLVDGSNSPIALQVVDDPKTTAPWSSTPWVHSKPITGEVAPLFYNPADINFFSGAKTETNNFQFGYFSGIWQWGDLYLSNSQKDALWHKITKTEDYYFDFNGFNSHLFNQGFNVKASVPFAGTSSKHNYFTIEKGISFTHQDNKTGSLVATGETTTAKEYYMIVDGHYATVKTGSSLPRTNGALKAYASCNVYYGMKGSKGDFITVNIGTKRKVVNEKFAKQGQIAPVYLEEVIMNNDILGQKWVSQKGITNQGSGSAMLKKDTEYEPGFQYYYEANTLGSKKTASISLTTGYQFVYEGYDKP